MKKSRIYIAKLKDPWIVFAAICIFVAFSFIILPQIRIFISSMMTSTGTFTLENYITFFTKNKFFSATVNSLKVTFFATGFAALIAIPLSYLLSRYEVKGKNNILTIITMAASSPPFLGAYAWVILLGRFGVINKLIFRFTGYEVPFGIKGQFGVIWVIIWLVFPLIFLLTYDSFTNQDVAHKEASLNVGANKFKTMLKIELPLASPGIITGLFMAGLAALSDFGTPAIIGREFSVLPTLIYDEFISEVGGNLSMAATVGIIMIIVSTIALYVQRYLLARKTFAAISVKKLKAKEPSRKMKILIWAFIIGVLVMAFLPHITLLVISFMKFQWGILSNQFTLENYAKLFNENLTPIGMTFLLGGIAIVMDVLFGLGIAYIVVRKKYKFFSNFIDTIFMIPYIVPGIVLAVSYIIAFNKPPIAITGTGLIMILAYFIRKLPFTVKSAQSSLYKVHPAFEEAAMMCGANPLKAFKDVTFRLMIGGVISGATLSFLHIMSELSTTIILYRPPWVTMVVVIFQNTITTGSDIGLATAMGVVLMAFMYIPMYFITKSARKLNDVF